MRTLAFCEHVLNGKNKVCPCGQKAVRQFRCYFKPTIHTRYGAIAFSYYLCPTCLKDFKNAIKGAGITNEWKVKISLEDFRMDAITDFEIKGDIIA